MERRSVFISYSREDLELARQFEKALVNSGIVAWRDQESIYAGQQWPKAIGEAISEHDLLLLLWSKGAAGSHFVEFEWTTAIALKKTIVPCLLDQTPLVPSLISFNGVVLEDVDKTIQKVIQTIERTKSGLDINRSRDVLKTLQQITPQDSQSMARAGTVLLSNRFEARSGGSAAQKSSMAPAAPQLEGLQIGDRYQVIRMLGRGGMGAVYQVHDRELDRDVALKVIRGDMAEDPVVLQRFKREIQLSSEVTHANVLRVYDLGEGGGVKFLTMQYVEGEDLTSLLRREGALDTDRLLRIFSQICQALAAAHNKGVLHRDLKPSNIMISQDDHVYLTDFGLATSTEQSGLTQAGELMGTPHYMSPEQVKGEKADSQSDIYSLGVILYEMCTGQVPFEGATVYEVMIQRVQRNHRPANELNPNLPPFLVRIIDRCMAKDRVARYATVNELLSDVEAGRDSGQTLRATTFYVRRLRGRTAFMTWRRLALAIPLLVLTVLGGFWIVGKLDRPEDLLTQIIAHQPVSVLVADFDNQTGDPLFDGALEQTLATTLEGASFITTFNRGTARKIAAKLKDGEDRLRADVVRLVAQREGIGVIIDGTITLTDGEYQVSVSAIDALTGDLIDQASAQAGEKGGVLSVLGQIAAQIRKTLGDTTPLSAQLAAAETVTASSLEAVQTYAVAQDLQGQGNWEGAIASYNKAVELDPGLGRAYAGLAVMYRNLQKKEEAEAFYQLALKNIDRMSQRERFKTRGGYFLVVGNYPKAIEEMTALINQYPADFSGHTNLALAHFYMRSMGSALEAARRAVEIYPSNVVMRGNLAYYAMYAGDFESAAREAERIAEEDPSFGPNLVCLALSYLGKGEIESAVETYKKLGSLDGISASLASIGLADLQLYEGRFSEAVKVLQKSVADPPDGTAGQTYFRQRTLLSETYLALGKTDEALSLLAGTIELSPGIEVLFEAGQIYIRAGQEDRALEIVNQLKDGLRLEARLYGKLLEGELKLARKEFWEAIRLFHEAQKLNDTWWVRFSLGRAYLEAGAFTEAYSEFEICQKRRGEASAVFLDDVPSFRYLAPLNYYLGRSQEGLESPAAADSYREFLAYKESSEPDPLVNDARKRLVVY